MEGGYTIKKHRKVYFIITSFIILLIAFWIYRISIGKLPYIDRWTRSYVELLNGSSVFYVLRDVTELGSGSFLLPFTVVGSLFLLFYLKRLTPALILSLGTLGTYFINTVIKYIIKRDRPSVWIEANAEGYSFPSGHSMVPAVCYGLFIYYVHRKIHNKLVKVGMNITLCLLLLSIGFSRYVINVHFLTDIFTGFTLGVVCLLLLIQLDKYIDRYRS